MKIKEAIDYYTKYLALYSETPKLDSEILIGHTINKSKAYLYTWPELDISQNNINRINDYINLRIQGISIAHIIGKTEFWDMTFFVNKYTLAPRTDTETIIEVILDKFNKNSHYSILELGTGTGAIAITLAKLFINSSIHAVDISKLALVVANKNARHNKINNIEFIVSDWFTQLDPLYQYDLIVSNPPYIDYDDQDIEVNVRQHEPEISLFSKDKGLYDLHKIISQSTCFLKPHGTLILEHGHKQGKSVMQKLYSSGYHSISSHYDLNKIYRVTSSVR